MSLRIWCDDCEEHYWASDLNMVVLVDSTVELNRLFTISTWCPKPKCRQRQVVIIQEKSGARDEERARLLNELLGRSPQLSESPLPPEDTPPDIIESPFSSERLADGGCPRDPTPAISAPPESSGEKKS